MSRIWSAEVVVNAPPELVWSVLVDFEAYPSWNPFTREVRTTRELGSSVRMHVDMGSLGMVRQKETLVEFEAPRRLAWALDAPPRWILWARRVQRLEALDGDRTRYRTDDEIGGLLQPYVAWRYGSPMQRGFEGMAAALVAEVDRRLHA